MADATRVPNFDRTSQSSPSNIAPGTTIRAGERSYQLGKELGSGGQSRVFALERGRVLKLYNSKDSVGTDWLDVMKRVTSEAKAACIPIYQYGFTDDQLPYAVEEQISKEAFLSANPSVNVMELFRKLVDSLSVLHKAGIVHGDLKPENIVMLNGKPRFLDFGNAHVMSSNVGGTPVHATMTVRCTSGYAAPEIALGGLNDYGVFSVKTDVYSLAGIMGYLQCGKDPFVGDQFLTQHIMSSQFPVQFQDRNVTALVTGCFQATPETRWSMEDVKQWLANPGYRKESTHSAAQMQNQTIQEERYAAPFVFCGERCLTMSEIVKAFQRHWTEGMHAISSGKLLGFLARNNSRYTDTVRAYKPGTRPDIRFARLLIDLGAKGLAYKGKTYIDLKSLAAVADIGACTEMLTGELLSDWGAAIGSPNTKVLQQLEAYAKCDADAAGWALKFTICKTALTLGRTQCGDINTYIHTVLNASIQNAYMQLHSPSALSRGFLATHCGCESITRFSAMKGSNRLKAEAMLTILYQNATGKGRDDIVRFTRDVLCRDVRNWIQLVNQGCYEFTGSSKKLQVRIKGLRFQANDLNGILTQYRDAKAAMQEFSAMLLNDAALTRLGVYGAKTIFPRHTKALLVKAPEAYPYDGMITADFRAELQRK